MLPLVVASAVVLGLSLVDFAVEGGAPAGVPYPVWLAGLLGLNVVLTVASPSYKRRLVRTVQRFVVNPPVKLLLRTRLSLGWCLLETRGRTSGLPRQVPVGDGLVDGVFWIIAEHGDRAGYVRNLRRDPRVRVLVRDGGWRMRWVDGIATVLDDDDPYRRQRLVAGWRHPVRAFNAMTVRILGTELRSVRVDLVR